MCWVLAGHQGYGSSQELTVPRRQIGEQAPRGVVWAEMEVKVAVEVQGGPPEQQREPLKASQGGEGVRFAPFFCDKDWRI